MNSYVAIAYRQGYTNDHHYLVAAGGDREGVLETARATGYIRNGKYGVLVQEVGTSLEDEPKFVAYFPSARGELAPGPNPRTNIAQRIGYAVLAALEKGFFLQKRASEECADDALPVPEWLRSHCSRVQTEEAQITQFAENRRKHTAEKQRQPV